MPSHIITKTLRRYLSLDSLNGRMFARYEATITTGLENLAKDEVDSKLHATQTVAGKGRVTFSTDSHVKDILKLRSICNLFVILHDEYVDEAEMPSDSASLTDFLMKAGDKCSWQEGLKIWKESSKFQLDIDKLLTNSDSLRAEQPKFRVSSNRYGQRHKFTSPEICSIFGHVVDTKFGWPIKMKDYDLEIMANFNENRFYVALTLTSGSLDFRNIVNTGLTTLKATTCYALLRLAQIQPGDIVIDPMAGSGAIPVECCACWSKEWLAYTIASEWKQVALDKCRENIDAILGQKELKPPADLLGFDVRAMPFRPDSIDVFVSDLPFGHRHGSKKLNRTLYPALLRDMGRIARLETGRAILLTQDYKSMNLASTQTRNLWSLKLCNFVKVGNLPCHIYCFMRTNETYIEKKPKIAKLNGES